MDDSVCLSDLVFLFCMYSLKYLKPEPGKKTWKMFFPLSSTEDLPSQAQNYMDFAIELATRLMFEISVDSYTTQFLN